MDKRFELLKSLGAGDFQHLNGDLQSHLKGTANILKSWGASETLQTAGLFHAAYGTTGFDQTMVSLEQRHAIANVIGEQAEALVYLYCSCDRNVVFPQFGRGSEIVFRDRFTNESLQLSQQDLHLFCELTVANELELVYSSEKFKQQHGSGLFALFCRMEGFLSDPARQAYQCALGNGTKLSTVSK